MHSNSSSDSPVSERPDTPAPKRAAAIVLILIAAALVVGLDLARQPADSPADLSISQGVLDEGIWSHNAVNDALFHRARLDDLNPMYVTSAPDRLVRLSYALFGVGILQTRLPSIILGALTVIVVGLLLARDDPVAGIVAAWTLATSFLFLMYSRLGLLETTAAAFLALGLFVLVPAIERPNATRAFVGGLLIAVGVTSKPQSGAAAIGLLIGIGWYVWRRKREAWRAMLACLAGIAVIGAAWGTYVAAHLDRAVKTEWKQHALGIDLSPRVWLKDGWRYLSSNDGAARHAAPLLIAAALGLLLLIAVASVRAPMTGAARAAAVGWSVTTVGALAAISYSPSRYAVLALPGLAMVAGGGVSAARALWPRVSPATVRLGCAIVIAGIAAAGLVSWGRWAANPSWTIRDLATLLERQTNPGDVIVGGAALVPATDAHRRVVAPLPATGLDSTCPIERYHARFVILNGRRIDQAFYRGLYPRLLDDKNLVARPLLNGIVYSMYRVPPDLPPAKGCA
jgi:4-amino-4-deoxy-L-arabinose transferase-like glycosyltransferase